MTDANPVARSGESGLLVGRDRELTAVRAVVADARTGRRGVVVVEGDAGMGKTALVRGALADEAALVVWVSGDDAEVDFDHGIVDQILRSAPVTPPRDGGRRSMFDLDPVQTGSALVGFVDGLDLDPARPLILVVDDAHWADTASLRALTFTARRIRRDPVVLILTVRRADIAHLPEGLRRLADDEGTYVSVEPLGRDHVSQLAEQLLGESMTASATTRLVEHTGGSPLHLVTLLREISLETLRSSEPLPVPKSYATLVLSRIARCGVAVEALVSAVAVLGGQTELSTAATVGQVDDAASAADEACRAGLLTVTAAQIPGAPLEVSVSHPLVQAAALGDLPVSRRAALHRAAADAVDGPAGVLHRLRGTVGTDDELWCNAIRIADQEADRGAFGTAATLLREAARVAAAPEGRDRAVQEAVHQLLLAGRAGEASSLAAEVSAAPASARRSFALGRLAYTVGERRDTQDHLDEAWSRLRVTDRGPEPADTRLAAEVAVLSAFSAIDQVRGADAIRWSQLALALDFDHAAQASAAHALASGHAIEGSIECGRAELAQVCADATDKRAPVIADATCGLGLLQLWAHDLDEAATSFSRSLEAALLAGSSVAVETARGYLAETYFRQGRWDDAASLAQISLSIIDDSDQYWMIVLPNVVLARLLTARGDEAGTDHAARAEVGARDLSSLVGIGFAAVAALEVGASLRDYDRVVEAGALLTDAEVPEGFGAWRGSYAEALVAIDRADDAAGVVEQLAAQLSSPGQTTDLARAGVVVAAAQRDATTVDQWAECGLAVDADAAGPFARARFELVCGRAWRHRGERRRAAAVLEAARDRFLALRAEPWLDQVEREIVALGLRPVRRSAVTGLELTPQEQAIARLVMQGLTNREVAAELVVSAKTVEHHLSRVYAKLGIRGRTQLALRLAADPT